MSDFFAEKNWSEFSDLVNGETEFIPLISSEDEDRMNLEEVPEKLPILPLRNNVLFPGVVIPITLGRDKSIKLIQDANKGNKIIGIPTPRAAAREELMVGAVVLVPGNVLQITAGKRHLKLKFSDLEHYRGERGRRGHKLPRGFQKVDKLDVEAN